MLIFLLSSGVKWNKRAAKLLFSRLYYGDAAVNEMMMLLQ